MQRHNRTRRVRIEKRKAGRPIRQKWVWLGLIALALCASAQTASALDCDFDADGFEDLAVGSPQEGVGLTFAAGAVLVFYGSSGGFGLGRPTQYFDESSAIFSSSPKYQGYFGYAVDCGDYDGDGYDDLAVARPWFESEEEESPTDGVIWILFGSSEGLGERAQSAAPPGGSPYFGAVLASGDFNGDGYSDLAVGTIATPLFDEVARHLFVFWGGYGGLSAYSRLSTYKAEDINGAGAPYLGTALAVGDFDSDGLEDLVATSTPGGDMNRLVLLHGRPGYPGLSLYGLDNAEVIGVAETGDVRLTAGDFDGDGESDLAVGVTRSDLAFVGSDPPRVDLYYQRDGQLVAEDEIVGSNNSFGASLGAGDYNGDGCDDLAVGIPAEDNLREDGTIAFDSGQVYVVHCDPGVGLDPSTGYLLQPSHKRSDSEHFGWAMTAGDFNGDGLSDLMVGAPGLLVYHVSGVPRSDVGAFVEFWGEIAGEHAGLGLIGLPGILWHQDEVGVPDSAEAGEIFGWGMRSSFECWGAPGLRTTSCVMDEFVARP